MATVTRYDVVATYAGLTQFQLQNLLVALPTTKPETLKVVSKDLER